MGNLGDLSDGDLRWLARVAVGINPPLPLDTRELLIFSCLIEPVTPSVHMVTQGGLALLFAAYASGRLPRPV